jgi:hypothetical protein
MYVGAYHNIIYKGGGDRCVQLGVVCKYVGISNQRKSQRLY